MKNKEKFIKPKAGESFTIDFISRNYNYVNPKIMEKSFKKLDLYARDNSKDYNEKRMSWNLSLSGSKASELLKDPLKLLLYYLQIIPDDVLNKEFIKIPRMDFYKNWGLLMEETVGAILSNAVDSLNNTNVNNYYQFYYEHLVSHNNSKNINLGLFIKHFKGMKVAFFKDTMYKTNTLISANIDGLVINPMTDEIEYIIEIKTKSEDTPLGEVRERHFSQAYFYNYVLRPKKGVIFAYLKGARFIEFDYLDTNKLEKFEKENNIEAKIESFDKWLRIINAFIVKEDEFSHLEKFYDIKKHMPRVKKNLTMVQLTKIIEEEFLNQYENNSIEHLENIYTYIREIESRLETTLPGYLVYDKENYLKVLNTLRDIFIKFIGQDKYDYFRQKEVK